MDIVDVVIVAKFIVKAYWPTYQASEGEKISQHGSNGNFACFYSSKK